MQTFAPLVQTEAEGQNGVGETTQTEVALPEPLVNGTAPALWAGAAAFFLIFFVGMMLIIRGRVTHAKPRTNQTGETRTYFEPAGEDAEIDFDDDAPPLKPEKQAAHWRDDEVNETEVVIEHDNEEQSEAFVPTPPMRPEKKKSAFAGLFSKSPEPEPAPEDDLVEDLSYTAEDDTGFFVEEPIVEQAHKLREPPHWKSITESLPHHTEAQAAEQARIAHAEEAAQAALQRAEEAEALARDLKRANEEAQNVMTLGLRKQEAALSERTDALIAVEKRLAALSDEFHNRAQAASVGLASASAAALHDSPSGVSEDHFAEFANLMGEQFDALRNTVNGAIERLSKRLDHLPAAPAGAGTSTAARVQLSDLLGDALAAQRFKLGHRLSTGRTADAIITMPGPIAPLAIDARFPAEMFDAWQMSRNAGTEMELRRAVLRNIADAGEKLIAPEETADCALMFIPSEHILSELHASFSDLIQESYRARVWMVSPTSLMATLHTISAVMAGAGIREASAASVIDELHALRTRVSALEGGRRPNGAHHAAESPEQAASTAPHGEASTPERIGEAAAAQKTQDDKSPFPLR
ncbi:DNA recombination protein RmuC [Hyphococcus sp.]|uniref:DNA recombination protein RmuC n=1 Tax=Hyphococcus sp. TaxID=2038636 RepID=UPI00208C4F15|nr:MAG: hypothetical protein DHS20C04_04810 [Marinicaulis sp.]